MLSESLHFSFMDYALLLLLEQDEEVEDSVILIESQSLMHYCFRTTFLELIQTTHDFVENECTTIVNNLALPLFSSYSSYRVANDNSGLRVCA